MSRFLPLPAPASNFITKVLFLFVAALFSAPLCYSQSFEGEIVYKVTMKSKLPADARFSNMLGDKHVYTIRQGAYKIVSNGTIFQWELYKPDSNKLYLKSSNSDVITWKDAGVNTDTILKINRYKKAAVILGRTCDEIELICQKGIEKYYYDPSLAVSAQLFAKHKYQHWYAFVSESHALPLKITIENAQFSSAAIASSIKPIKFEPGHFDLPRGARTAKSPF
jgi:hypothetical protein